MGYCFVCWLRRINRAQIPLWESQLRTTLCLHLSTPPPPPRFLNSSTVETQLIVLVTRTVDQDGKAAGRTG